MTGIQPDSEDGAMSAKDFHRHMMYGSQTDAGTKWQLRHVPKHGDMTEVMAPGTTWIVHQVLPGGEGHWWGIKCEAND